MPFNKQTRFEAKLESQHLKSYDLVSKELDRLSDKMKIAYTKDYIVRNGVKIRLTPAKRKAYMISLISKTTAKITSSLIKNLVKDAIVSAKAIDNFEKESVKINKT